MSIQINCSYKELRPASALQPHPKNPNSHPKEQIMYFKEILKYNGIRRPVTVSARSGFITKGHGLFIALSEMGIDEIPIDLQPYASEEHELADIVADNQLTKMAIMEYEKLKPITIQLHQANVEPRAIGLSAEQVQALTGQINIAPKMFDVKPSVMLPSQYSQEPVDPKEHQADQISDDKANQVMADNDIQKRAEFGDVWKMGDHLLVVGDSTDPKFYSKMQGPARLLTTDPPYGVEYEGGSETGMTSIQNDDRAEWTEAYRNSGAQIAYVWHAATKNHIFRKSLEEAGYSVRQEIVWVKPSAAFGRSHYHWQHEPCWYAVKEGQDANWLGTRNQSTVWAAASPLKKGGGPEDGVTIHPTQKPVILYEIPILNHTFEGEVVVDCFSGSGTLFIACERTKRKAYGIEFDPIFANQILARWEKYTGKTAEKIGQIE